MRVRCCQNDDGSWIVTVPRESGIDEVIPIGPMTKDSAAKWLLAHGYDRAVLCGKEVFDAMRAGQVGRGGDVNLYRVLTE
jgi:hypothetical protein